MTAESSRQRVVLAPDVLGRAFSEPPSLQVLELWRDGRIQPVVNRDLLLRYVRLLRGLGLPAELARRWSWWFTSAHRCLYLDQLLLPNHTGWQLCADLARQGGAGIVVYGGTGDDTVLDAVRDDQVRWLHPAELVARYSTRP